jgi:hypothetical protein
LQSGTSAQHAASWTPSCPACACSAASNIATTAALTACHSRRARCCHQGPAQIGYKPQTVMLYRRRAAMRLQRCHYRPHCSRLGRADRTISKSHGAKRKTCKHLHLYACHVAAHERHHVLEVTAPHRVIQARGVQAIRVFCFCRHRLELTVYAEACITAQACKLWLISGTRSCLRWQRQVRAARSRARTESCGE